MSIRMFFKSSLLSSAIALVFLFTVAAAGELPLEVRLERYRLEIENAFKEYNFAEAAKVLEEKMLPLRDSGVIELPKQYDLLYAFALSKTGRLDEAMERVTAFLMEPGLDKELMTPAVQLQIEIENAMRQRAAFKAAEAQEQKEREEREQAKRRKIEEEAKIRKETQTPLRDAAQAKSGFEALTIDCGVEELYLIKIPAGTFTMGSPDTEPKRQSNEQQRQATISKPFFMGMFEVTQAQYLAVTGVRNPSTYNDGGLYPVDSVSWEGAVEFCRKLSEQTGRQFRLPTESEWEYACRAGTLTPFNTGETLRAEQANFDIHAGGMRSSRDDPYWNDSIGLYDSEGNGREPRERRPMPVGSFPPNAWGLYDMHGNVEEWCSDVDPQGAKSESDRVVRSGCYDYGPASCRSAFREFGRNTETSSRRGFRVVVDE